MAQTKQQVIEIELSKIDATDTTYQVRDRQQLDENHLESLQWSDPDKWIALVVKQTSPDHYIIVSGFHRYEAAKRLELPKIKVTVLPAEMSEIETKLAAYKYNSEHGLPLTTHEKKQHAIELYKVNPDIAHYQIAKMVHLSDKTVTTAINAYLNSDKPATDENATDENATDKNATDENATDEIEDEIDFPAEFKSFAGKLRKFYDVATLLPTNDEMSSFLARAMTRQAKTDKEGNIIQDDDLTILKLYAEVFNKAIVSLTPKTAVKPVIKKATKK